MRVLLIDREAHYYAGAERMLENFVAGAREDLEVVVAASEGARLLERVPPGVVRVALKGGSRLRPATLLRQARQLARLCKDTKIDVVHAWVARDWELAALVALLAGVPAMGTLHDHPQAAFIGPARRELMRFCGNHLLRRVAVVSHAVESACRQAGYRASRLRVIHNGLPYPLRPAELDRAQRDDESPVTFGFLGVLSERKGLKLLLATLEQLSRRASSWRLLMAGEAQDESSRRLKAELVGRYAGSDWWDRVEWLGWLTDPAGFWRDIDVLVLPSTGFDPFPTVVLEAAYHGVPVVSTDCGGMSEMIEDGHTGWVIPRTGWPEAAADRLASLAKDRNLLAAMGAAAFRHCASAFSMRRMVDAYQDFFRGTGKPG